MSSRRVFTGQNVFVDGVLKPATVVVDLNSGKIADIIHAHRAHDPVDFPDVDDAHWIDAGDKYIIPGLVECVTHRLGGRPSPHHLLTLPPPHSAHVHLNEPGRTDWEGFWTGTRAAASGGVTTVVDMPLNSIPPTTTVAHLEEKRAAARGQCWTDVAFWGGVIPGNQVCLPRFTAPAHALLPSMSIWPPSAPITRTQALMFLTPDLMRLEMT